MKPGPHGSLCRCCEAVLPGPGSDRALRRRGFVAAALGAFGGMLAAPVLAQSLGSVRRVSVQRQVTGDSFAGIYWRDGQYDRAALRRLDHVFRDLSAAETTPMDPRLFDVLATVAREMDTNEPFQVISGYRAPETNAASARRSRRVATTSLHMSGMAADCRLPGRDSLALARTAADLQLGGVGLYRRDGFIHLDCGPVRRW